MMIRNFISFSKSGGILTCCPNKVYKTVSLGCFIQDDTALADLRTTADVIKIRGDFEDVGYIIPQSALPMNVVQKLVHEIGKALLLEQYLGYYGVDLVVFYHNDNDEVITINFKISRFISINTYKSRIIIILIFFFIMLFRIWITGL